MSRESGPDDDRSRRHWYEAQSGPDDILRAADLRRRQDAANAELNRQINLLTQNIASNFIGIDVSAEGGDATSFVTVSQDGRYITVNHGVSAPASAEELAHRRRVWGKIAPGVVLAPVECSSCWSCREDVIVGMICCWSVKCVVCGKKSYGGDDEDGCCNGLPRLEIRRRIEL